jgi:hypothetical protein
MTWLRARDALGLLMTRLQRAHGKRGAFVKVRGVGFADADELLHAELAAGRLRSTGLKRRIGKWQRRPMRLDYWKSGAGIDWTNGNTSDGEWRQLQFPLAEIEAIATGTKQGRPKGSRNKNDPDSPVLNRMDALATDASAPRPYKWAAAALRLTGREVDPDQVQRLGRKWKKLRGL